MKKSDEFRSGSRQWLDQKNREIRKFYIESGEEE